MDIRNHRIDAIWRGQTGNLSAGTITPKLIVVHYTTGWNGAASRDWLLGAAGGTDNRETSCHVVIDRDGTAWQIAPFNRRAWHAGRSAYGGLTDLNTHSIGVEFVNPGWLRPDGPDAWRDCYSNRRSTAQLERQGGFVVRPHARVGGEHYAWPNYTPEQIATGRELVRALARKYPIRAVVSHEEIDTRGWKTDPGPAFPMRALTELLDSHRQDAPPDRYIVTATRLNIRGGPDTGADRIDPPGALDQGTGVIALRREGDWVWAKAVTGPAAGVRGWVHGAYLTLDI